MKTKTNNFISKKAKKKIYNPTWKRLLFLTFSGIIIALASRYFIVSASLYSPGISGVAQGITYNVFDIFNVDGKLIGMSETMFKNTFYWIINMALNLPIMYYSITKYGKRFFLFSTYAFAISITFSMFFTYVPGFAEAEFIPPELLDSEAIKYSVSIIAAAIGGLLTGVSLGIIFRQSASSFGIDPIAKSLSREKGIDLKIVLFAFSIVNTFIWTIVSESYLGNVVSFQTFITSVLFNVTILASIVFLAIYSFTTAYIYPSANKYNVRVITKKAPQIIKRLKEVNFHRPQTVFPVFGGSTNSRQEAIDVILFNEEISDLMSYIYEIDDKSFITVEPIKEIYSASSSEQSWKVWTKEDAAQYEDAKKIKEKWNIKNKK